LTVLRSPLFGPLRSPLRSPLALRKGGGGPVVVFADDFSTYANDAALQAVWTQDGTALRTLSSGRMRVENGASTNASTYRSFTTVANTLHTLTIDNPGAANFQYRIGSSAVGQQFGFGTISAGAVAASVSFTPTSSPVFFTVRVLSSTLGAFTLVDNILITR